jgi:hypothetical protein
MMYAWMFARTKSDVSLAPGESVCYDLGNTALASIDSQNRGPDSTGKVWNSTSGSGPEKTLNMTVKPAFGHTSEGRQTQVVMKITDTFSGYVATGVTGTIYDTEIAQDAWITAQGDTAALKLYGLVAGAHYEVSCFATHNNDDSGNGRAVRYQIGVATADLNNIVNNLSARAVFTDVVADASGTLTVQVMPKPGTTSRYGLISALEVTRLEDEAPSYFDQDFAAGGSYASYVNTGTLTTDLFSDISAEVDGGAWSISSNALQLVRSGVNSVNNGAGFTRYTVASGAPNVAEYSFKITAGGISGNGEIASLDAGGFTSLQDYNATSVSAGVANRMAFKAGGTDLLRFTINGNLTGNYSVAGGAVISISWMLNQSGTTQTYMGLDGLSHTLTDDASDLWVNGSLALTNIARTSTFGSNNVGGFRWRTGVSLPITFKLDDILIYGTLPQ